MATSYVTDVNSPAIPAANVLNVPGGTITTNNTNGVQTDGSSGSNTLTIQLTNRVQGTGTTTDGVTPVNLFTFALGATPATYLFEIKASAFDTTSNISAGYVDFAVVRTTGAAGSVVGTQPALIVEEGVLSGTSVNPTISGNNFLFDVTGVAGETINWYVLATYTLVT